MVTHRLTRNKRLAKGNPDRARADLQPGKPLAVQELRSDDGTTGNTSFGYVHCNSYLLANFQSCELIGLTDVCVSLSIGPCVVYVVYLEYRCCV